MKNNLLITVSFLLVLLLNKNVFGETTKDLIYRYMPRK